MAVRNSLESPVQGDSLRDRSKEVALSAAEAILGHQFDRPDLLREALTHRSAARGRNGSGSNERLEFIGDRVLGLLIAEWLAERFPDEREGELGRRLAYLVSSRYSRRSRRLSRFLLRSPSRRARPGPA